MRCLKADTDDLFYICINNIPKLEKHVLEEVIKTVERSKKVKHLSLAMTGIIDTDAKVLFRSSHRKCSVKKSVLRNFTKFTGKHLCQRLFFNKVAGLRPANLLKKSLWRRCFLLNFAKFLRKPLSQNTFGRMLLTFVLYFEVIFILICLF